MIYGVDMMETTAIKNILYYSHGYTKGSLHFCLRPLLMILSLGM